jgi:seryl-tRNA synthetase
MLDIKFIRENAEKMKEVCKNKNLDPMDIDRILSLDGKRRKLISQTEELRARQKKLGRNEIIKAKELKEKRKPLEEELDEKEKEYEELMLKMPNVYSERTPIGADDSFNKEIYRWGKIPEFDFPIKDHLQIGKNLDLIDIEKGVKTSGFRGYYLKNEAAFLQFALMQFALEKLRRKGFTIMIPPIILREFALVGSGHFPYGKDEVYQIANPGRLLDGKEMKEKFYLGGTSESALLAYYADTILEEKDLPIKLAGFSPCYRSEVGSYGKDAKGLYRLHEFMKIEQVVLCQADLEKSSCLFEEMSKNAQEILKDLELPYRVLQICSGDMGAGKYEMQDIETWMPSRNSYGETHSDSNLTDWQARRLNIKYKTKDGDKKFAYTLNNTMIASPRILIAILENHQQKDGSVKIPDVLEKYLGFNVIKK